MPSEMHTERQAASGWRSCCRSDQYTSPFVLWTLVVAYGSLTPPAGLPSEMFDLSDKLCHVGMYAVFALLLLRAWVRRGGIPTAAGLGSIAVAATWGVYLECLQGLTIERSLDWTDAAANAIGAVAGVFLLSWWRGRGMSAAKEKAV